ncbi:MAG: amino acid--tRNA ligase-related protein [Nanobdellota archaeon]
MIKREKISNIETIIEDSTVVVSGRVVNANKKSKEKHFYFLKDDSGYISLTVDPQLFKNISIGDLITVSGDVTKYTNNNAGIVVTELLDQVESKGMIPNKDYFYNEKNRLNTSMSSMFNPDSFEFIKKRSQVIKTIRTILDSYGFIEVDTPILSKKPTASSARPFIAKLNSNKKDIFLRKSTEEKLKELVISGFEKIYELGKVFRNEGKSKRYLPEYMAVDILSAYSSLEDIMELSGNILVKTSSFFQSTSIPKKFSFKEIMDVYGQSLSNDNYSDFKSFKKNVEPKLLEPTIVHSFPSSLAPSAIAIDDLAQDFKLYYSGIVVMHGYSLETNFDLLSKNEINQIKSRGDKLTDYDLSFQSMLKYGMPPTSGVGFSVERLLQSLSGKTDIRETMNYPLV